MPRLSCSVRRAGGTPLEAGFAAKLDARRLTLYRIGQGRETLLASRAEPTGSAVFGAFARDPRRATIRLRRFQTIGFAGTGIGCFAVGAGSTPAVSCFLRSHGRGPPGPYNYWLLAHSYGFFLSAKRLQLLAAGREPGPNPSPAGFGPLPHTVAEWHL